MKKSRSEFPLFPRIYEDLEPSTIRGLLCPSTSLRVQTNFGESLLVLRSTNYWLMILSFISVQFSSVQSLSWVWLFATPWIAAHQASLSITISWSSLKLMSIELVMPSSHLILCCPFSSCPQSLPTSEYFPMSQLFTWGGQSTGVSALASFLPKNTQVWSPLEWTGWISLQSKGHQFFSAQLSSQSNSHIHTWPLDKPGKGNKYYYLLVMSFNKGNESYTYQTIA